MKLSPEQERTLQRDHGICRNEALSVYFDLPSGPEPGSPLGVLIQRIVAESPGIDFDEARRLASEQLWKAAGRKNYRVTTPGQDRLGLGKFKSRVSPTLESGKTGPSGPRSFAPETSHSFDAPETAADLSRHTTAPVLGALR
jgi:hypothetical protein